MPLAAACPEPDRCFEVLFSYFFRPRAPVRRALRALPRGHCRLGIHARSAATIATRGASTGVSRMLECAKGPLGAVGAAAGAAAGASAGAAAGGGRGGFVWLASGSDEVRDGLAAGLRAGGAIVHMLGAEHDLPKKGDLTSWGQPIFTYSATAMQTAAVDILALARCDRILGTRHSTFSYVAQAIASRPQARIRDEEDAGGGAGPVCKIYSFTQPVYHPWTRYLRVGEHASCRARLRSRNSTLYDTVFEAEYTLPIMSQ